MNRIIENLPDPEYRSANGLSNSMLKHFMRSPAHYKSALTEPHETTKAMNFGTALHQSILTPDLDLVVAMPECDGRTKEGKAIKEKFAQESVGKTIVTAEEYESIKRMTDSVYAHPVAKQLLERMKSRELSVFAEIFGIPCKGRMDMVDLSCNDVGDLKSCEDASPEGIRKAIRNYRYDIQQTHYNTLLSVANAKPVPQGDFFFIFTEKTPPYPTVVAVVGNNSVDFACRDYADAMNRFKVCSDTDTWGAYGDDIKSIEI